MAAAELGWTPRPVELVEELSASRFPGAVDPLLPVEKVDRGNRYGGSNDAAFLTRTRRN